MNLTLPGFEPVESTESTPSAAGFPAKTSPSRARVPAWTVSDPASGESTGVSLAIYDRKSSSWRTSGLFVGEDSPLYSETLPRSGMTRNGMLYLLQPLVRLTSVTASGSSQSMPTPTAKLGDPHPGVSLTDWARGDGGTGRLLPTPQAQDSRNCADYSDGSRGHSPQLRHLGSGRLNPRFVEWMMGLPPGWTDALGLDRTELDCAPSATQSCPPSPTCSHEH